MPQDPFLKDVIHALEARPLHWETVLGAILNRFECRLGTIHRTDRPSGLLELVAHVGVPDAVLPHVGHIPIGKGMAGLAAERREPVQVCNLQTDASGDVRMGARKTGMEGSIAVPMLVDDDVRGVLGVAKPVEYTFTDAERALLLRLAAIMGAAF